MGVMGGGMGGIGSCMCAMGGGICAAMGGGMSGREGGAIRGGMGGGNEDNGGNEANGVKANVPSQWKHKCQ